ncbi:L-threonylcarbamoyladenylate synthase [Parasediminibacterium paludis]|uniref:L-threonylcarbamoyladenylate synthase n=1 Tax=Parasediminibacterium paludis TaxID=908966 RepID=A0ABV8PQK9_9BACT
MSNYLTDIEHCLRVLENGGLILYPTDTIWGIGCDATNEAAVAKIYTLKQQKDSSKMIVLVATERDVMQYISTLDLEVFNFLKTCTKPTTVIYNGAVGIADNLIGNDGSLAIRICNDEFCKHLLKRFKKPIVSTSAHITGTTTPLIFKDIDHQIIRDVDYVVNHRQDDKTAVEPSSIIQWLPDQKPNVLRY